MDLGDRGAADGGIIYVLTNEAMPNMVKIGRTSGESVERRVAELSRATGVPVRFRVAIARRVHDAGLIEKALHVAFGPDRVNPAREFFQIDVHRVVQLIKSYPGTDITPQVEAAAEREIERVEPGAVKAEAIYSKRRPPLNFLEMAIPLGAQLIHVDTEETAEVIGPRRVRFRGHDISLTQAQRIISGKEYNPAPGNLWLFEGRPLSRIYAETYPLLPADNPEQ
jgi:hypothetical protein